MVGMLELDIMTSSIYRCIKRNGIGILISKIKIEMLDKKVLISISV